MTTGHTATVTLAGPNDVKAIAALFAAMDRHYQGRTLPEEDWVEKTARYLAEPENGTRYALARVNGAPVGIACFTLFRHGLVHAGSLFLKDLYVLKTARGSGAGEALMRFVARFARDRGVDRIDLTVDAPNDGAIRFYARLGGQPNADKQFYRFDGEAFATLANY